MGRFWLMMGCLFAGLSVLVGAFAAHALKGSLDADAMAIYDTATRYMMFHAVALLALGLWSHWEKWSSSFWAGFCFVLGIILFSGSLYGLVLLQIQSLAYLTPAGGILFVLGWSNFMVSIFFTRNKFV
jgi:uncharacterized membrane protein YgdD (TMEM256/DUF423 family)